MNPKIRILFVTKSTGGVAEYVHVLVRNLDRKIFDISAACLSENGPEFAALLSTYPDVKTFSLEMNRYQVDFLSDLKVFFALYKHIRNGNYDLIHAHASKPGFLARLAAWGTGIPVLYSPHCFAFHDGAGFFRARVIAFLEFFAAKFLTKKIVLVADGEKYLAQRYGVGTSENMATIYTGIDTEKFSIDMDPEPVRLSMGVPKNAFLVGAVGRMSTQKAPLDFVKMAFFVHQNDPSIHFAWIGSGPLQIEVESMIKKYSLKSVFHLPGQRVDIPGVLNSLDCFVLCSLWEGFPISLLEAMAAGKPIIATDIPGSNEAVRNNQEGWLVPAGDPKAMSEALNELIHSPEKTAELCKHSRKRVEQNFRTHLMIDKLQHLYQDLIIIQNNETSISPFPESMI